MKGKSHMKETNTTAAWRQYEAGKAYKRRIGLYETVRQNERFYRGDQWHGTHAADLPRPVFNLVKRITDYLICTVAAGKYAISYTDENLPFNGRSVSARTVRRALELLTGNARYRWERCKMDDLVYRMLLDAAVSGDGALMCYWDPDAEGDGMFRGDIAVQAIDSVNLFAADMNRADIQSQEYLIVSGRAPVSALRREAEANGVSAAMVARIVGDDDTEGAAGDYAGVELEDGGGKATYLIKFWREDGKVVFQKSVREVILRTVTTDMRRYPIAYFNWTPAKNCFHGASPISAIVPNQKYVNRAYAMVMKHMTDTAFSKVVYDKSRIPEWTGAVGEAIGVMGAANVSDAVSVLGTGEMQDGYLQLIDMAVSATKELSGATETALGNTNPTNTSAILALKETSRVTLEQVSAALAGCIEDLAAIWADMMCAYYDDTRLIPYANDEGIVAVRAGLSALKGCLIRAKVEVTEAAVYGDSAAVEILDRLLDGGHISAEQYVLHLPDGLIAARDELANGVVTGVAGGEPNA